VSCVEVAVQQTGAGIAQSPGTFSEGPEYPGEEKSEEDRTSIPPSIYMKTNDRNSPNTGGLHFLTSQTMELFSGGSARRSWEWDGGGPEHPREENTKSNSTSIPPSIYLKINDGDSPNTGELHFAPPEPRNIFQRECYGHPWERDWWTARP
jgi:hypothetical protein